MINELSDIKVTFYSNINNREQIEFECSLGRMGGVHICVTKENNFYCGDKTINEHTEEIDGLTTKKIYEKIIKFIKSN